RANATTSFRGTSMGGGGLCFGVFAVHQSPVARESRFGNAGVNGAAASAWAARALMAEPRQKRSGLILSNRRRVIFIGWKTGWPYKTVAGLDSFPVCGNKCPELPPPNQIGR